MAVAVIVEVTVVLAVLVEAQVGMTVTNDVEVQPQKDADVVVDVDDVLLRDVVGLDVVEVPDAVKQEHALEIRDGVAEHGDAYAGTVPANFGFIYEEQKADAEAVTLVARSARRQLSALQIAET